MEHKLTTEQQEIFNQIKDSLFQQPKNNCFFINSCAASGLTYLFNYLIREFENFNNYVQSIASYGTAASLLKNGATAHDVFRIEINQNKWRNFLNQYDKERLSKIDIFIWDEASLIPHQLLDMVDNELKLIMNNELPFGGKIMIIGGDFYKLQPINGKIIKYSKCWEHFKEFHLNGNLRLNPFNDKFAEYLSEIRNGRLDEIHPEHKEIITFYDDHKNQNETIFDFYKNNCFLGRCNEDVEEINKIILDTLPGEEIAIEAIDYTDNDIPDPIAGLPPKILLLKKGAIIMLVRTVNSQNGLINGARLCVRDYTENTIIGELISGYYKGEERKICGIQIDNAWNIRYEEDEKKRQLIERYQFPVRLSFAMTTHKVCGLEFNAIRILARQYTWDYGELYTVYSRVSKYENISFCLQNGVFSIRNYINNNNNKNQQVLRDFFGVIF